MSTLDVVRPGRRQAANFLDIGGGASAETHGRRSRCPSLRPKVRSVLVNIFGGITPRDLVAQGSWTPWTASATRSRSRWWCGWTAPTPRRAVSLLPAPRHDKVVPAATMLDAARTAVELADQKAVPEP